MERQEKSWIVSSSNLEKVREISTKTGIPPTIAAILLQRGFCGIDEMHDFLNPDLSKLPSPMMMKGMEQAVALVSSAIDQARPLIVYGDYDADGITASAVLVIFLQQLGAQIYYCQPQRLVEGYGLNIDRLRKLAAVHKNAILITVDCGISDCAEVDEAKRLGFSVIITDHHLPPPVLPAADVILNPLQPGCNFPCKQLAGVGVAFYLLMGLRRHLLEKRRWSKEEVPNLKKYLDLVAIGTIADLVPLKGVNRILCKAGLETLQRSERPGLKALFEISGLSGKRLTAVDINYVIAPRLNAAGRLGDASGALELLITQDHKNATQLAAALEEDNEHRKSLEQEVFDDAFSKAKELVAIGGKTIVLTGESWHPGVIGIVASRLMRSFFRPAVLLTPCPEGLKGSCRSIPAVNLYQILAQCRTIKRFGGHQAAAGLTLEVSHFEAFRQEFEALVTSRTVPGKELQAELKIAAELSLKEVSKEFLYHYLKLEPFGMGNEEPIFAANAGNLRKTRVVGNNHLKFIWQEEGLTLDGIGFGFGALELSEYQHSCQFAFQLRLNEFRGESKWQVNLEDIKS